MYRRGTVRSWPDFLPGAVKVRTGAPAMLPRTRPLNVRNNHAWIGTKVLKKRFCIVCFLPGSHVVPTPDSLATRRGLTPDRPILVAQPVMTARADGLSSIPDLQYTRL